MSLTIMVIITKTKNRNNLKFYIFWQRIDCRQKYWSSIFEAAFLYYVLYHYMNIQFPI